MPGRRPIRSITPGVASVRVSPGWTTVTLMPHGPSSSARFFVIAATATLRIEPITAPVLRAPRPGDVDDPPPALVDHQRGDGLGAAQVAEHLDVHVLPEQLAGDLGQLRRRRLAERLGGAVDEDVDAAQRGVGRRRPCARTDASSPVSTTIGVTVRPVAASQLQRRLLQRRPVRAGAIDDVAALVGQRPGHRLADAAAAAGDDRPLAREL